MNTYYRLFSITFALLILANCPMTAQRHFFKRIELGASNASTDVALLAVATLVNSLAKQPLIETQFRASKVSSDEDLNNYEGVFNDNTILERIGTWGNYYTESDEYKATSSEYFKTDNVHLFNHITAGVKLGYLSDYQGSVNYCIYGSAHYNTRQLKQQSLALRHNVQRLQIGGGAMLVLGSIEQSTRYIIEGGLRYNIPAYYSNTQDIGRSDMVNAGLSSHYGFRLSFSSGIAVGLQFDCMHYNLFKDESIAGKKNKIYEGGLIAIFLF